LKCIVLILSLLVATGAFGGALGDPKAPVTHYSELAGTLVIDAAKVYIFKSNGHEYYLSVEPSDPGVDHLKSGMAIIVKGMVTVSVGPHDETTRTLRPQQMIIRGRVYQEPETPNP